jgi:hypothetical protein
MPRLEVNYIIVQPSEGKAFQNMNLILDEDVNLGRVGILEQGSGHGLPCMGFVQPQDILLPQAVLDGSVDGRHGVKLPGEAIVPSKTEGI